MFCRSLFVLLAIVLSVLLRFIDSDYPFGIFNLFIYVHFIIVSLLHGLSDARTLGLVFRDRQKSNYICMCVWRYDNFMSTYPFLGYTANP